MYDKKGSFVIDDSATTQASSARWSRIRSAIDATTHVWHDTWCFVRFASLAFRWTSRSVWSKLWHLKVLIQLPKLSHVLYIWTDYCCISQLKERADNQCKAIDSLAYYARNSTHFVSLYGEIEQWSLWDEYIKRGWCRIEILAATSSKMIKMWKSNIDNINNCVLFKKDSIPKNPLEGDFWGEEWNRRREIQNCTDGTKTL